MTRRTWSVTERRRYTVKADGARADTITILTSERDDGMVRYDVQATMLGAATMPELTARIEAHYGAPARLVTLEPADHQARAGADQIDGFKALMKRAEAEGLNVTMTAGERLIPTQAYRRLRGT